MYVGMSSLQQPPVALAALLSTTPQRGLWVMAPLEWSSRPPALRLARRYATDQLVLHACLLS